jgi:hypothetical protein
MSDRSLYNTFAYTAQVGGEVSGWGPGGTEGVYHGGCRPEPQLTALDAPTRLAPMHRAPWLPACYAACHRQAHQPPLDTRHDRHVPQVGSKAAWVLVGACGRRPVACGRVGGGWPGCVTQCLRQRQTPMHLGCMQGSRHERGGAGGAGHLHGARAALHARGCELLALHHAGCCRRARSCAGVAWLACELSAAGACWRLLSVQGHSIEMQRDTYDRRTRAQKVTMPAARHPAPVHCRGRIPLPLRRCKMRAP